MNGEENNNNVATQEQVVPEVNTTPEVVEQPNAVAVSTPVEPVQTVSEPVSATQVEQSQPSQEATSQIVAEQPTEVVQTGKEVANEAAAPSTEAPKVESSTQPHNPKVNDQVIFEMPQEKDGSILGILFFFGLIVAFVFFLPNINKFLGKIFPSLDPNNKIIRPRPVEPESEETTKKEAITYYNIDGMVSNAKIDDLSLGNFVKDNNDGVEKIKFYLLNNGDNVFSFNDKTKFFLDFYDNTTYISSVLVYSFDPIASKESKDFSINISKSLYTKANKFTITRKKTTDYPQVTLSKVDGDYKVLTCSFGNETVGYYFIDNYLEMIDEEYNESNSVTTYSEDLQRYNNLASKYQGISAISYDVIESDNNFVAKTKIKLKDINDVDLTKLATYKYFPYHKESNVVSFEMIALGYTCS